MINVGIVNPLNDCDFALEVKEEDADRVLQLCFDGLRAWFAAASEPVDAETLEYFAGVFTEEDFVDMYNWGYAEPTMVMLDKEGIWYEDVTVEYDDDGEPTNLDKYLVY